MKKPDTKTLTTQLITDNVLGSFLNYMPNPDTIVPGTFSSYDTYREMRTDPRIKSLLNKLKTAALNFPIHITQPDGCPDDVFAFVKGFDLWNKLYQKLKRIYSSLLLKALISGINCIKNSSGFIPVLIMGFPFQSFSGVLKTGYMFPITLSPESRNGLYSAVTGNYISTNTESGSRLIILISGLSIITTPMMKIPMEQAFSVVYIGRGCLSVRAMSSGSRRLKSFR